MRGKRASVQESFEERQTGGWEELCVEKEVGVKRVVEGRKEEGESNEREGGRDGETGGLTD